MDTQFDRTRTTVIVEGTTGTLKEQVDKILAGGGRIVSVQTVVPAGSDNAPSAFRIVYKDGN